MRLGVAAGQARVRSFEPEPLLCQPCLRAPQGAPAPVPVITESCIQGAVDDGECRLCTDQPINRRRSAAAIRSWLRGLRPSPLPSKPGTGYECMPRHNPAPIARAKPSAP